MTLRYRLVAALVAGCALFSASPAAAQARDFSIAATEACLERTLGSVGCIGLSAGVCIGAPEWVTEADRSECYRQEFVYWQGQLDALLEDMRGAGAASDEMLRDHPTIPRQMPAIDALDERFVAYRAAFCDYEETVWGGGNEVYSGLDQCQMALTGLQVLLLQVGLELR